jgi:hypothetical protein
MTVFRTGSVILLGLLLGLLFAPIATAQVVSLSGRVTDPQGGVVAGAVITLGQPYAISRSTRSGPDGTFTFAEVANGSYTLDVDAEGFQRWSQGVAVEGEPTPVEVSLQVAGINESVSVVVSTPLDLTRPEPTGSRLNLTPFETPASIAVISGDAIRDLGTQTLIQAKGLAPGITSSATPGNGGNVLTSRGCRHRPGNALCHSHPSEPRTNSLTSDSFSPPRKIHSTSDDF